MKTVWVDDPGADKPFEVYIKQSRKHSHYEVITNQVVGIIIGWLIVYAIFPFLSDLSQVWLATASSVIFFVSSYTRSYVIRRLFA